MKLAGVLAGLAIATAAGAATRPATRAAAPARADWLTIFAATPQGGFRVGNPAAKVRLIEYGSLTCPHCRAFRAESNNTLRSKYVASGQVSLEFRPFVLNGPDFVATMIARCGNDPRAFYSRIDALYDNQESWLQPFLDSAADAQAQLQAAPEAQRVLVLGQIGKFDTFMAAHGMPPARFAQCLTDKPAIDRLQALQEEANVRTKITGTPTFFINGVRDDGPPTWAAIEPLIVRALR